MQLHDKSRLYFIAIVPPEPVFSEVRALKKYMSGHFDSHKALRSPPHITLVPPFRLQESEEDKFSHEVAEFLASFPSFHLELENFAAFPPRVIYVQNRLQPLFIQLETALKGFLKEHSPALYDTLYKDPGYPFNPHMTIAFKDLSKENFRSAWKEFQARQYHASFTVREVALLKHNLRYWEIYSQMPLAEAIK